ncbi:MAG TPA: diguanylate cyclase [Gammaproteobacteria bacterium]|nr:diguanylate cyclase [Gammaproteobacteria bacterium]
MHVSAGARRELADLEWVGRLFNASPLGVFLSDAAERCVYANTAYHDVAGLARDRALGTAWSSALHPEDRERVLAEWRDAAQSKATFRTEARFRRPDGSVAWVRLHADMMPVEEGNSARLLMVEDITKRKSAEAVLRAAEEELFAEKERAQVTLDSIGDAVLTTDVAGNMTYLNLEAESLTGWSRADAIGRPMVEVFRVIDGETRDPVPNPAQEAIEENRTVGLATGSVLIRRDESEVAIEDSAAPIHRRDGTVCGAVIVFHDVVKSRAMTERMAHLARHDFLTGLANPALLGERMKYAIDLARRHRTQAALLFLDLDDFKDVNDSLGHLAGDELLKSVARRLEACVRSTDTACRRSGDEFILLLSEIACPEDAARVAEKVLAAIREPHAIGGHMVKVGASIGISICPHDGDDPFVLMQCADQAMYKAKASSLEDYRFSGAVRPRRPLGWRHATGAGADPRTSRAAAGSQESTAGAWNDALPG